MLRRISVRGIVLHDGRMLGVKLKDYKGSINGGQDYWCLPGGGFHITNGADYLDIDLSMTSHGETEIAALGFIDPRQSYVKPHFLSTEDLAAHTAAGGPPRIYSYPD